MYGAGRNRDTRPATAQRKALAGTPDGATTPTGSGYRGWLLLSPSWV